MKHFVQIVLVLSLATSTQALAYSSAESDLELVQRYVRTHESVPARSAYLGLLAAGFMPWYAFAKSTRPALMRWGPIELFLAGIATYAGGRALQYYLSHGQQGFRSLGIVDREVGLTPQPHELTQLSAQMTPEEIVRVDRYLKTNRSYLMRFFNPFIASFSWEGLAQLSGSQLVSQAAGFATLYMFVETVIFKVTDGRVGPVNRFIDQKLGFVPEEELAQAQLKLKNVLKMPPAEAQKMLDADPVAKRLLSSTANIIRHVTN